VDASDAQTYRKVRPGLDFDRLLKNVETAVDIRNALGGNTRVIVSAINQQGVDIDEVEAFWSRIADKVQIRKYLTWGYNEDNSADSTPYLPPDRRVPCPWLFERMNIDSRGDVTLCGEDIAFDEKFANVMERSIKDIWLGPEFEAFREMHLSGCGDRIPICSKCPDWKYRSWRHNYWKVLRDADKRGNA
jgi:radical SAM protein with 4Fe4S-binding SPASM domain